MPTIKHTNTSGISYFNHECSKIPYKLLFAGYGHAIYFISWDEKLNCWLAENGEYATEISYCPWCGEKLVNPSY